MLFAKPLPAIRDRLRIRVGSTNDKGMTGHAFAFKLFFDVIRIVLLEVGFFRRSTSLANQKQPPCTWTLIINQANQIHHFTTSAVPTTVFYLGEKTVKLYTSSFTLNLHHLFFPKYKRSQQVPALACLCSDLASKLFAHARETHTSNERAFF